MKSYPLDQSPFYRLASRKKLAAFLGLPLKVIESIANNHDANYSCYPKETKPGKTRFIERPKPDLRPIQKKITKLLGRISYPSYLYSAYKGRSYVLNAAQHPFDEPTGKIDIKKFFPSASSLAVHKIFLDQFQCSPDVSAVLSKLVTFKGHIPTGGNSSTMISFWAYKPMFDEIDSMAKAKGIKMTCIVDDMTFSGKLLTGGFLNDVANVVHRYGLKTHKRHVFKAGKAKIVTGVAITPGGSRLPNTRRLKLHESFSETISETDPQMRLKSARRTLGRASEAEQVEPRFRASVTFARVLLNDAKDSVLASVRSEFGK